MPNSFSSANPRALARYIEQAPVGIGIFKEPSHTLVLANPAFRRLAELAEGAAGTIRELITGQNFVAHFGELDETFRSGTAFRSLELETSPGCYVTLLAEAYRDEHGAIAGLIVTLTDISAEVVAKRGLEEEKRERQQTLGFLGATLESIADAVIAVTFGTIPRISFLNSAAAQMTGWDPAEAVGKAFAEVVSLVGVRSGAPIPDPTAGDYDNRRSNAILLNRQGGRIYVGINTAPLWIGEKRFGSVLSLRDMTERQQNEQRLKQLNSLLEHSPDFIGMAWPDGRAFYVNPAGRKLVGLKSLEEASAKRIVEYLDESEHERVTREIIPHVLEHGAWDGRLLFKNFQTGEQIPFSWNIFAITAPGSREVVSLGCVSRDLRAQEKSEADVRAASQLTATALALAEEGESKFRSLANSLPDLVWTSDAGGHVDYYNDRWYEFTGLPRGGHGETSWVPVIHEEDRVNLFAAWNRSLATGEPYNVDYRMKRARDGQYRWMNGRAMAARGADGEIVRWYGSTRDIEEEKRRQLYEQEEARRLVSLLTELPTPFFSLNNDYVVTYANPAAELLFRTPLSRVVGQRLWETFPGLEDTKFGASYKRAMRERVATTEEDYYAPFDRWYEATAYPYGEGVAVGFLDTTARKQAHQAEVNAREAAERANEAKSQFLANMSHEIRTPLGAIMGFSDLLKRSSLGPREVASFVGIIDRNSQHLLRIIDDILDLAKVEAGQLDFERIVFSLPELIADFCSLMGFRAREKGIDLKVEALTPVPECIESDPTRLRQILTNVVGNAIKFTEHGGVTISLVYRAPVLEFSVRDTGRGISPAQAERLFKPFMQADASTTRQYGGTGLGLVLTRRLAEAMGGKFILAESLPEKGSTFVAAVTIGEEADTKFVGSAELNFSADDTAASPANDTRLKGRRILVVDDSPDNRTLLGALLRESGAEVEFARDGAEGVERALGGSHDLVLMDIQMPRLDGYQALRTLRDHGYRTPIVALTAHAMAEEKNRAESQGFAGFATKPVVWAKLLATVESVLPNRERFRGGEAPGLQVLLIEDDADILDLLGEVARGQGAQVRAASTVAGALDIVRRGPAADLVLLDLSLAGQDGSLVLGFIRKQPGWEKTLVYFTSGWNDIAERARSLGADGSLKKPVAIDALESLFYGLARKKL